jgi:tetratricopeptide (TPR) repeat protein
MGDMTGQSRRSFLEETEALLEKGDFQAVLDLAALRLQGLPGDPDARIAICRVRVLQGRLDEAGEMLHETEDLIASLSQIYRSMGDLFLEKGMPESAQTYYRKFIALNPDAPDTREIAERLEGISEPLGTDDGAGTETEEETIRVPDDFQTVTLAELYIRQGHLQMAKEILEAILLKDPREERAAERLREVTETLCAEGSAAKTDPVIAELSRWLDNIGRLYGHAA